jgi:hypothetical protein
MDGEQPAASAGADITRSAMVVTIATLIGHLIPLLRSVWLSRMPALITAIAPRTLALLEVGVRVGDADLIARAPPGFLPKTELSAAAIGRILRTG